MAFAFNQPGGHAPSIDASAELTEINTQSLGFSTVGGHTETGSERKLKLLPTPYPKDSLPPSSACLLSVASGRGLVAAAGPDCLILASTESVRKAFREAREAGEALKKKKTEAGRGNAGEELPEDDGVITNFQPQSTIPLQQLRQVAFSCDEDLLVLTAERGGGLAVYSVDDALQQKGPALQISTDEIPVRTLAPNPELKFANYFAAVLESGKLIVVDVTTGKVMDALPENVTSVAWSTKGRALIAGLTDGSAILYKIDGGPIGTIPRPPEVGPNYAVSAVYWLQDTQFFVVHSPNSLGDDTMEDQESTFHIVKCDKRRTSFSFHKSATELLYASFGPQRSLPPRYNVARLRKWEPHLDDMLVIGASNSIDFTLLTSVSAPIAAEQEVLNDYTITGVDDNRRATLPVAVGGDDEDSVLIGEALDLSSNEKVVSPIPADDEYTESPGPLPALFALSYQGLLSAWWIVYDKSIREGTNYPGLVASSHEPAPAATPSAPQPTQSNPMFGKPSGTFGTPAFGTSGFQAGNATFGKPSQPAFGANSSFGKPSQPAFGTASTFGKPSQPAFGSASAMGAPSGFGAAGALGKSQSPWAATSQNSAPQTSQNPFSSQAGTASGFAKFGTTNNNSGSAFSSLGNKNGQSPFSALGGQKSAFAGTSNEPFKGTGAAQSFGSTVTVGSSLGDGSTLPSWANTPAQQNSSMFGAGTTSFSSAKESDMSDADDAQNRERDEATPTPQPPPQQANNAFGLPSEGFKLVSSFKGDGSAKDDLPEPSFSSGGSLFGGDFASTLSGAGTKPPATPIKKEEEEPRLQDISTTPASPPKPSYGASFPSATPSKQPAIPTKDPSPQIEPVIPEDAPLPPDPTTWKPKSTEDDLPPLAGSPAIKVEAPDSDVPSSPLENKTDKEDDFSVEEQDGDDEDEQEPSPSDAARRTRQTGFRFQDSVNQSPQIRPAAPTPPTVKSGPSSQSGDRSRDASQSPAPSRLFGQAAKQGASSVFQQSMTPGGFPKPTNVFPPTSSRAQESLRSPSPVRAASTSAIGTRRQQMTPQGPSLPSPAQQAARPPTPQPELSDLFDDENERIRQELASEIVPSRTLDKFIAHQDYTGSVTKTGTAAQIEIIYRDMNSMVDTLGLNSRSLTSWIAYHNKRKPVSRDDLEEVNDLGEDGPWFDGWCLAQIEDLKVVEQQLQADLEAGRVQNVLDKLAQLARLLGESSKVFTKINDIRRQIINRKDPERAKALRNASLPKELSEQQKALRLEYSRLLTLLSQTEEAAFLLKSKLSSTAAANGKSTIAVPTVDAVKKTINKLIQMTEKKNNDILLLEAQMRKLHLSGTGSRPTSSSSRTNGTPRSSRARQSPLPTTPQTGTSKMSLRELNRAVQTPEPDDTPSRGYGLYYTPEGSPTANGRGSLSRLADQMEDIDTLERLAGARAGRTKVANALMQAVRARGVKVTTV